MDPIGRGAEDVAQRDRVRDDEEREPTAQPDDAPLRGLLTPRRQIVLIAIGIALFNVVLIGVLIYLFVVY